MAQLLLSNSNVLASQLSGFVSGVVIVGKSYTIPLW